MAPLLALSTCRVQQVTAQRVHPLRTASAAQWVNLPFSIKSPSTRWSASVYVLILVHFNVSAYYDSVLMVCLLCVLSHFRSSKILTFVTLVPHLLACACASSCLFWLQFNCLQLVLLSSIIKPFLEFPIAAKNTKTIRRERSQTMAMMEHDEEWRKEGGEIGEGKGRMSKKWVQRTYAWSRIYDVARG